MLKRIFRFVLKLRKKIDQKVLIFGFFLLLSTVFWFLNKLNEDLETSLTFPVRYINLPRDRVLVNDLPQQLNIQVQAPGYTLLRYKLISRQVPIVLNVDNFNFRYKSGTEPPVFFLLSQWTRASLEEQLLSEVTIMNIQPDTLFFSFDSIARRRVPVKPVLDLQFARQFQLKGSVTTVPDSVVVSGPRAIIDTFSVARTRPLKITGLDHPEERTISMEEIPNVSYSHKRVDVSIPVEQFTESVLDIPIAVENVPDSLSLKIFPSHTTLTFMVGLSDFGKIQPGLFRAVVQFPSESAGKLNIDLVRSPDYIRSVKLSPSQVEYIIEKK